jgi:putative transposase
VTQEVEEFLTTRTGFARSLDDSIERLGLRIIESPLCAPMANAICERLIGTIRRECLDWVIPMSESHLRSILTEWGIHYNGQRLHMSLGPGVPDPPQALASSVAHESQYPLSERLVVQARPVLGGLHDEYSFATTLD